MALVVTTGSKTTHTHTQQQQKKGGGGGRERQTDRQTDGADFNAQSTMTVISDGQCLRQTGGGDSSVVRAPDS